MFVYKDEYGAALLIQVARQPGRMKAIDIGHSFDSANIVSRISAAKPCFSSFFYDKKEIWFVNACL